METAEALLKGIGIGAAGVAGIGAIIASIGFLVKNWVIKAISYQYDTKLENLKSELRLSQETFLENIRADRAGRESIRAATLANFSAAQQAAYKRRIEAVEVLWKAVLQSRTVTPEMAYIYTVDAIGYKEEFFGPNLKNPLKSIDYVKAIGSSQSNSDQVTEVRPFIGEELYSLFSVFSAILGRSLSITCHSYQQGKLQLWFEEHETIELLKRVLTEDEWNEFSKKKRCHLQWFCQRLESKISIAIARLLSGEESATATAEYTSKLIDQASALSSTADA